MAARSPKSPSSRPREMVGQPSHEEIKPKSAEWKEEKAAHILNVHLPGFVKEQIRVTYDDKLRFFNVQGDRPLGNNRFGRLNTDFTAPDNCRMKDTQGTFQDEVLTITIPKEYVSPFFDPKQSPPENDLSVTHEPPAISEPPKVPPSMPTPETAFSPTTKPPGRESDQEKLEDPKREPGWKSLDPNRGKETPEKEAKKRADDTDVAVSAGKEIMRPKNSDLVKPKAGEIVRGAEKQLIVNVGVAALVLVAFGSYVGYNFACLRSAKD